MRRTMVAIIVGVSCVVLPLDASRGGPPAAADSYASIDGAHLKGYVEELAAMSRRYRDNGHPQFWGRIIGSEADAQNGRWLLDPFKAIGLSDVRAQPFHLPPTMVRYNDAVDPKG